MLFRSADWALVDGPVGSLLVDGKARWHQLAWCAARCPFTVLHDAKRDGERRSLDALRQDGWNVTEVETPRGFAIIWRGCEELMGELSAEGFLE